MQRSQVDDLKETSGSESCRFTIPPSIAQAKPSLVTNVDHCPSIRSRVLREVAPYHIPICVLVKICCLCVVEAIASIGVRHDDRVCTAIVRHGERISGSAFSRGAYATINKLFTEILLHVAEASTCVQSCQLVKMSIQYEGDTCARTDLLHEL